MQIIGTAPVSASPESCSHAYCDGGREGPLVQVFSEGARHIFGGRFGLCLSHCSISCPESGSKSECPIHRDHQRHREGEQDDAQGDEPLRPSRNMLARRIPEKGSGNGYGDNEAKGSPRLREPVAHALGPPTKSP